MIRYIALLRAINVGGHKVKMDRLRKLFESLGLSNVETFIASGNVNFDSPAEDARTLEKQIEDYLRKSLGFEVATFVRLVSELEAIAGYRPFMPPNSVQKATRSTLLSCQTHRAARRNRGSWLSEARLMIFASMGARSTGCAARR